MPQLIVVAVYIVIIFYFYLGYVVSKMEVYQNVNPSQVVQNNKVEDIVQNNPQPSEQNQVFKKG